MECRFGRVVCILSEITCFYYCSVLTITQLYSVQSGLRIPIVHEFAVWPSVQQFNYKLASHLYPLGNANTFASASKTPARWCTSQLTNAVQQKRQFLGSSLHTHFQIHNVNTDLYNTFFDAPGLLFNLEDHQIIMSKSHRRYKHFIKY